MRKFRRSCGGHLWGKPALRLALAPTCALLVLLLLAAGLAPPPAQALDLPDRRRDQYPGGPGYLFVPAPYSLPGIGQGIAWVAYLSNVALDYTDAYFYWITGDAQGFGTGLSEIHLYPRTLFLDLWIEQIDKAQVFQYPSRGMDTAKNDYLLVDVRNTDARGVVLTLALAERRFEGFLEYESFKDQVHLDGIVNEAQAIVSQALRRDPSCSSE